MTPPPHPFKCHLNLENIHIFQSTWLNLGNTPPKTRPPTALAGVRVCRRKAGGRVSEQGCGPTVQDSATWLQKRRRATASQSHSPSPCHAECELFFRLLKKISWLWNIHFTVLHRGSGLASWNLRTVLPSLPLHVALLLLERVQSPQQVILMRPCLYSIGNLSANCSKSPEKQ